MSSGKPQTRGLAALLRIEKERRAREESAVQDSVSPSPEGAEDLEDPREVSAPAVSSEPAATTAAEPSTEAAPADTYAALNAVEAQPSDIAPPDGTHAKNENGTTRTKASNVRPTSSLPRPRRVTTRPVGASRKGVESETESILATDPGWEKFVADWKPFLREGIKFKLCEFFYSNTAAAGRRKFTTSSAELSRVSGAHRRHIFLVLRQLEELRFIRKESIGTNRKGEGLVINFFPDRQA